MTDIGAGATAIFEGIREYWNREREQLYVFRLEEHLERCFDGVLPGQSASMPIGGCLALPPAA